MDGGEVMAERWDRALSTGKLARALGLSNATVQAYARDGLIPASTTPGGHYRFNLEEVREVLSNDDQLPAEDLPPIDGGSAVLVSMRAMPPTDDRARAYLELRGHITAAPSDGAGSVAGADDHADGTDDHYSLDGLIRRAPAAVASYLQLR